MENKIGWRSEQNDFTVYTVYNNQFHEPSTIRTEGCRVRGLCKSIQPQLNQNFRGLKVENLKKQKKKSESTHNP